MNEDNRRLHIRHRIDVRITVMDEEIGGSVWFDAGDISIGGVYLVSDFLLEKGTEVTLSFSLPDEEDEIEIKGLVAHANLEFDEEEKSKPAGMGIQFDAGDQASRKAIKQFLDKKTR